MRHIKKPKRPGSRLHSLSLLPVSGINSNINTWDSETSIKRCEQAKGNMTEKKKASSLFDDIFKLRNTAPETDVDPEDPEDGFKASLVDRVDETGTIEPSDLRKKAAIISDDPRYKGKRTSRRDLYSDEDDDEQGDVSGSSEDMNEDQSHETESSDDEGESEDKEEENGEDEGSDNDADYDFEMDKEDTQEKEKEDAVILPVDKSDDRERGKAVQAQLEIWDDLMKSRIALQKMVSACNRLPQPDTWQDFEQHDSFRKEAKNVHSSVRKVLSVMLELQSQLSSKSEKKKQGSADSDEEITSESEEEKDEEDIGGKKTASNGTSKGQGEEEDEEESEIEDDEEESGVEEDMEADRGRSMDLSQAPRHRMKRKLNTEEVEDTLAKRHKDFQPYRNDTLSTWDEKTRLTHSKVRSKNFAAFEMSVLKQIEQVLVNRGRLVRRLHQQRSSYKILGCQGNEEEDKTIEEQTVEDDDDDVEMKLKQIGKQDLEMNHEIIDDNDFYHICLRDLIETKQNEETDPATVNKQWLEIQKLRNKQKRKVDTRASKGRKIRYNVKEKLKSYMTPFDKSLWSDEQKDDLFKALFGGRTYQQDNSAPVIDSGIDIGI